jgi:dihydrodipicolinate synthase/N-acetylneuraminate lyase
MKTGVVSDVDRRGVIAVPPLCRRPDGSLDWTANERLVAYLQAGGISRLMYGGNAFLYHVTLAEYGELLAWLRGLSDSTWCIPSAGPSFGRLMDQAALLKACNFPAVMALPCADPRDAAGLEEGLRRFSAAAETPLIVYVKEENNFGLDRLAGLDAIARLVRDGVCVGIKYAVVRPDPGQDDYLGQLLERVERRLVISGIGERPAMAHWTGFGLTGFTSGSVCVAPALSQELYDCLQRGDLDGAAAVRGLFLPHEDLRDAWGPARVLHASLDLAGIVKSGPIPPFVSGLSGERLAELGPVARSLAQAGGMQYPEE